MRLVTLVLFGLLALVQVQLWLGEGGLRHVAGLRGDLAAQQGVNDGVRERNAQLQAELTDLKEGLEIVEERARGELGMLKPDELLVLMSTPRPALADRPSGGSSPVAEPQRLQTPPR